MIVIESQIRIEVAEFKYFQINSKFTKARFIKYYQIILPIKCQYFQIKMLVKVITKQYFTIDYQIVQCFRSNLAINLAY